MTQLSDAQLIVLSTASQRPDGGVFPITLTLKGNAIGNVLKSLINKELIEEVPGAADDRMWRYNEAGDPLTLRVTTKAHKVLGLGPDIPPQTPDSAEVPLAAADTAGEPEPPRVAATEPDVPKARKGTKQNTMIEMLRTRDGATILEIVEATGWQAHTVRGAIAGTLKKKLGLTITSEKVENRGRIYRIPA